MNLIWNNKLAAVIAGASMLAAVEFANIYVPDKIDDKFQFRIERLLMKLGTLTAKLGSRFNYGTEMEIFRNILNLFTRFNKLQSTSILVTDAVANDVPIRIYSPSIIGPDPAPVMFYYHGGAYCFGKLDMYDSMLEQFSRQIGIVIISVGYRLAPEYPYPIPINDCFSGTLHVLENMQDFNLNIDLNRVIFSGDSAGANIAAILSIQFNQQGKFTPHLQALIYPPTQYFSFLTPSSIQYSNLEITSRARLSLFHMGLVRVNKAQEDFLIKNYHTLLLNEPELKRKYEKFLSIDLIPEAYKKDRLYYSNFASLNDYVYPAEAPEYDLEKLDDEFVKLLKNLFNWNISPGLVDDELLKNQPNTLVLICEHDTRKDEGLIYAERLRLADNAVEVQYYENGYHGCIMSDRSAVSKRMRQDLVEFVRKNL